MAQQYISDINRLFDKGISLTDLVNWGAKFQGSYVAIYGPSEGYTNLMNALGIKRKPPVVSVDANGEPVKVRSGCGCGGKNKTPAPPEFRPPDFEEEEL